MQKSASAAQPGEYLTFRLGQEEYGIPILLVQEIRGYQEPTRLPNAPAYLKGLMDLRGQILPILDLRLKMGMPYAIYDGATVTIVLNVMGKGVGWVVDAVSDVVAIEAAHIRPALGLQTSMDDAFISGIASQEREGEQRMIILIDVQHMLEHDGLGLLRGVQHEQLAMAA